MTQIVLIGLAAGAASALLFATMATGFAYAMGFFYLTPLPIVFAGLAYNHLAGAVAAAFAAILLGAVFDAWFFLAFLLAIGVPAYTLAYLAMLARPVGNGGGEQLEWYPPGRLVLAAAILAAFSTALTIPAFGMDIETYREGLRQTFERLFRAMTNTPGDQPLVIPGVEDSGMLLNVLAIVMPPAAAALTMATNLVNLWLAGTIARVTGRLQRPWPDVRGMKFPNSVPIVLVAAIGGTFLPGLLGVVALILAAPLLVAYAVLGFAVVHGMTRTLPARIFVIAAVWLSVFVLGWPVLVIAILGLADSIIDFRGRASGGGPNLPTHRPPTGE